MSSLMGPVITRHFSRALDVSLSRKFEESSPAARPAALFRTRTHVDLSVFRKVSSFVTNSLDSLANKIIQVGTTRSTIRSCDVSRLFYMRRRVEETK